MQFHLRVTKSLLSRRCHVVAIGELPVDLCVKVGECGTQIGIELAHARLIRRHVWLRRLIDEVVREELFENVKSSFPLSLFGISTDDGFRRI